MRITSLIFLLSFSLCAEAAPLKVVTTIPDLAEAARVVGGAEVEVTSLLQGTEDAHFWEAVPTLIQTVANADVVCQVGLGLEVGWLPKVLERSGNARVQPGGVGYCDTGHGVQVLGRPSASVDRSMGDMHPQGNPHFQLSPVALSEAAKEIAATLKRVRPQSAQVFDQGFKKFEKQMNELKNRITLKLKKGLRGPVKLIEYHKDFVYFFDVYKLSSIGSIEEKPGVPPSAARLVQVAQSAKENAVLLALGSTHAPDRHLDKFTELSGIPHEKLPAMVQVQNPSWNTIEKVQDSIADAILAKIR